MFRSGKARGSRNDRLDTMVLSRRDGSAASNSVVALTTRDLQQSQGPRPLLHRFDLADALESGSRKTRNIS